MKKTISLLFVVIVISAQAVNAQKKTHEDSTEVINAAHRYALAFRLRNKDLAKFHAEHWPAGSDYFKPDRRTPNVLLVDSLFVKTYRLVAFDQTLSQKNFPSLNDIRPPDHPRPMSFGGPDYFDPMQDIASKDAERFNLSNEMLLKFKASPVAATSDYFKPSAADASDPAMLTDSGYVKTFRNIAYNKAIHQKLPK